MDGQLYCVAVSEGGSRDYIRVDSAAYPIVNININSNSNSSSGNGNGSEIVGYFMYFVFDSKVKQITLPFTTASANPNISYG